ncbi:MAG: metal-independent alpha-mannosidase, partial [Lachnospiraceae bacterium]|nr:metal-independent alpha-mannosidase [Lachnospiraceae bacterium]
MDRYIPTGNEMISLPAINEENASIESLTFLTMEYKGLIELSGSKEEPLFAPFFCTEAGTESSYKITNADKIDFWIPRFKGEFPGGTFEMAVLTPVGERGFAVKMTVHADKDISLKYGLKGNWSNARHCVNESKELTGRKSVFRSNWNNGPVLNYETGMPLFSFAPMTDSDCNTAYEQLGDSIKVRIEKEEKLGAGNSTSLTIFWGFGFEEVAAVTSAKEMLRRGFDYELDKTSSFLKKRIKTLQTPALTKLYNTNLFFCIFYSTGITLDTEELICATSRSTRYYVSAAYWDRDTLLWAFPAILDADTALAKRILEYVFTRQRRNFGVHSRFID